MTVVVVVDVVVVVVVVIADVVAILVVVAVAVFTVVVAFVVVVVVVVGHEPKLHTCESDSTQLPPLSAARDVFLVLSSMRSSVHHVSQTDQ